MSDKEFVNAPASSSVTLLPFDQAKVISGIVPGKYILVVAGTKPYANMIVMLSPLIYIRKPEYWGIEVVGTLPGIGIPKLTPYVVTIPLDGIIGSKGIEVIGSNKTKKINVRQPAASTKPAKETPRPTA